MSHEEYTTLEKAGAIKVKQTSRGLEFHAENVQRGRVIHVGTVVGRLYEKVAAILRNPEPSFCLTLDEFEAAMKAGAVFLRCYPPDKSYSYSISLKDFKRYAVPYHNAAYGEQMRGPLTVFQRGKPGTRNTIIDNPPVEREADPVREKQLLLLGWMR